jgi:hypothetical protein
MEEFIETNVIRNNIIGLSYHFIKLNAIRNKRHILVGEPEGIDSKVI